MQQSSLTKLSLILLGKQKQNSTHQLAQNRYQSIHTQDNARSCSIVYSRGGNRYVSGLSAFYCNPSDYSFHFLSYIATKERGKGIGLCLLDASLEYIKKAGMKGMDTQTWESNNRFKASVYKSWFC
jgi:hypothetical protein